MFCYFTYEGGVNLDKLTNEIEKEAMKSQIANFGQTPSQLLTKPHPTRGSPRLDLVPFCNGSSAPRYWGFEMSSSPVVYTKACADRLVTVDKAQTVRTYKLTLSGQMFSLDPSSVGKFSLGMRLAPRDKSHKQNFFDATEDGKYLFASGFWDKSIKTYSLETGQPVQTLNYHKDTVTCLSCSGDTLVTGSKDTTVVIWDTFVQASAPTSSSSSNNVLGEGSTIRNLNSPGQSETAAPLGTASINGGSTTPGEDASTGETTAAQAPSHPAVQAMQSPTSSSVVNANSGTATLRISEKPRHVLYGHDEEICALEASSDFDIVASGAVDGSVAVHTLRRGHFCWSTKLRPEGAVPSIIRITPRSGCVLVYAVNEQTLVLLSINGATLGTKKVDGGVNDIRVCSDERLAVLSHETACSISLYYLHSLEAESRYTLGAESPCIKSLTLTPGSERLLVAGTKNGSVLVMGRDDGLRQKKGKLKGNIGMLTPDETTEKHSSENKKRNTHDARKKTPWFTIQTKREGGEGEGEGGNQ